MNLKCKISDNVSELLVKIIEFTQARQKVLIQNIINVHEECFIPMEMEVDRFSDLISYAVDEHVRNERIVLHDTKNIKFGPGGSFKTKPVNDEFSRKLLIEDPDKYLDHQVKKLLENSLNQRIAAEMLEYKKHTVVAGISIE